MSELNQERWAVISVRGCEASSLKHQEAAVLMRRLKEERISGLCVVTDEAARRLQMTARVSANGKKPPAKRSARQRRTAKK